jgi:K+ potassium transporter
MGMMAIADEPGAHAPRGSLGALALGALGVVYGDIGTSPLYTMKTALDWGGGATPEVAVGMLSLIVWTLLITTSIKYVAVVMRADNDGEGGILALMSLLGIKRGNRLGVIAIGVLGAALLYGDGAITPAISVLSALEGLKLPAPAIAPYVVPLSVAVLVAIFALQPQGSARIGRLFGPIMTAWFVTIGVLGFVGVIGRPGVLAAFDPRLGFGYLFTHGLTGFRGRYFCAPPGQKRSMPIWDTSDPGRSALPGTVLSFPCCCSTMRARPRSWLTARLRLTPTHSSSCVRRHSRYRWSYSPPWPRSSQARRSSAAHFR